MGDNDIPTFGEDLLSRGVRGRFYVSGTRPDSVYKAISIGKVIIGNKSHAEAVVMVTFYNFQGKPYEVPPKDHRSDKSRIRISLVDCLEDQEAPKSFQPEAEEPGSKSSD